MVVLQAGVWERSKLVDRCRHRWAWGVPVVQGCKDGERH